MKRNFVLLLVILYATGCGVQVATEVQTGRAALISGNPELALTHFQRAVQAEPGYVAEFPPLQEGIWTYIGRAYYDAGKMSEVREALTEALKRSDSDFMARLYLGLSLLRAKGPEVKPDTSFALNDILYALRERISPRRLASLVKERGTKFSVTPEVEKELRKAGADDELVTQIRASAPKEPPPQQGLKEIDRALKEIQIWQERILKGSEYSRFWDSRKRIRSQIETSLTLLTTKKTDRQEFIGGLEWIGRAIEEEVDLVRRDKLEYDKRASSHAE